MSVVVAACGKSGPPLPPLIRIPAAPTNLVAERRGNIVDVRFIVPNANTDGTRPANIERVDVYAITGAATIADAQLIRRGTKVASVPVKAPRDPNAAVDPDDPTAEMEPPEGQGLDQGTIAHVTERLAPAALRLSGAARETDGRQTDGASTDAAGPLLGPTPDAFSRVYVGVGIATDGRRGAVSKRVAVPLLPPPPAPSTPKIKYDERTVTVTWTPIATGASAAGDVQHGATGGVDVLPSTPIGIFLPTFGYNVYDVSPADAPSSQPRTDGAKLTPTPVDMPVFEDSRIEWGARRCYTVRTVEVVNDLPIESEAPEPACETLTDTFAPAPPKGLQTVPGEGAINLIWEPSPEKDVAGYIVLRGTEADALTPITPSPIQDARFTDTVEAGSRFFYAVKAVDTAGNQSASSDAVPETAR